LDNYYDWIARIYDATRPLPQVVSEQVADCLLHTVAATPKTTFLEPGIGTAFALLLASNATFEIAVARDWKCAAQRHC